MIHFCANVDCGRGFSDCGSARPPKGWTPPTLCPTCRHGQAPLSTLRGEAKGERQAPSPSLEEQA